ncbi:hypothetical protein C0J52_27347, partial [Blattella germanica]
SHKSSKLLKQIIFQYFFFSVRLHLWSLSKYLYVEKEHSTYINRHITNLKKYGNKMQ